MVNKRILQYIAGNMRKATNGGQNPLSFAEVVGARTTEAVAYTALYAKANGWSVLGKPDVIMGILPIYAVQYLEIARSQDTLEFRSIGSEFMGHQKGGNLGIRIDCILSGPEQVSIANVLYMMHLMGREESSINKNLSAQFNTTDMIYNKDFSPAIHADEINNGITVPLITIENEEKLYLEMANNESIHVTTPDDMKYDKTAWHKTFTLVTPHEIVFDCFIESIVFTRDYREGSKVIKCTILLRQFIPPEYKLDERLALQATVGSNLAAKNRKDPLQPKDWRHLSVVKVVTLQSPVASSNSKVKLFQSLEKIDFLINVAYRTAITSTKLVSSIQRQKEYNKRTDPIGRYYTLYKGYKERTGSSEYGK
jgi:hypothetical protein